MLVLVGVVTRFRKMPKALLICNGKLRNFAYTFVTSFPTDLPSQIFGRWKASLIAATVVLVLVLVLVGVVTRFRKMPKALLIRNGCLLYTSDAADE